MAKEEILDLNSVNPAASPVSTGGGGGNSHKNADDMFNPVVQGKFKDKNLSAEEIFATLTSSSEVDMLPWEEITLPSRGLFYNGQIPGGVIKVRPMGLNAEKILATSRLAKSGQTFDYLYNEYVQLPNGFDQGDLLLGDRTFILYVLRGITHGNLYEFMMQCPECGEYSTYTYDLNDLAKTIKAGNPSLGAEPFKVPLPYLSKVFGKEVWVGVRLLRGKDVSALAQRQRYARKAAPAVRNNNQKSIVMDDLDDTISQNLNLAISDFMGIPNQGQIEQIMSKMSSADTATIREFLKNNTPGIDTSIVVTCPSCGAEFKTVLPITETFFRPKDA